MNIHSEEMEGEGGVAQVTISLVPKSTTKQGNATVCKKCKKRKHSEERQNIPPLQENMIQVDRAKLCQFSKYFETCMSGRWKHNKKEFHLEKQTEARFYHDCIARIYFPFKPIASVGDCVELLKVASQIDCVQVLDNGVKYLASVSWSDEEEDQIRSFCSSGQISISSTSDLYKRLQLHLSTEERQQNHVNLTLRILTHALQLSVSEGKTPMQRVESRTLFSEGFPAIVSGSGPGKCGKILEGALALVTEECKKLFISLKTLCTTDLVPNGFDIICLVTNICWLYNILREVHATQVMVDQVLKVAEVMPIFKARCQSLTPRRAKNLVEKAWAGMIFLIFHDVLDGRVLLTSRERMAFFKIFNPFFKGTADDSSSSLSAAHVCKFILTFPEEDQEENYRQWESINVPKCHLYNLSEGLVLWMKHLVAKAQKLV